MSSNDLPHAGRFLEIAEREVGRIILDIHDGPVQNIFAALSQLDVAQRHLEAQHPDAADSLVRIRRSMALLEHALTDIRTFMGAFRPPEFERRDLVAILEGLAIQHEELSGNEVRLTLHGAAPPAALPVKIGLYRILQEALANGVRHGHATRQHVVLRVEAAHITMEVHDNGAGFDVDTALREPLSGHFGLKGMRERVHILGGEFSISSAPTQGTSVTVRVPWR
jgi:signal transduction histidine kinase